MNIIQTFEAEQIAKLTAARAVPKFQAGDTLTRDGPRRRRRADPRAGL